MGQFGITGAHDHVGSGLLTDELPGFSGNAFFSTLVGVTNNGQDPNGETYLWANDQSQHSGVHRWHIVGANTIREQTATVGKGGTATLTPPTVSFPTALYAVPGNGQVTLSWTAASGASSYDVKQSTTSGGPFTVVNSTSNTSYTVPSLTNGTPYYFVVSAHSSSTNSNQVEVWPFNSVGKAGSRRGSFKPSIISVSSIAQLQNPSMPAVTGLGDPLGNLTRANIGTNGYVLYDTSGPGGGDKVNLRSGYTITRDNGWATQNLAFVTNRFDVDGNIGVNKAIYPNSTGTIAVNLGGATGVHYLTVFCPPFSSDARTFTITLTPTGQSTPSAAYTVSEPNGSPYLLTFQFEFTGNATLTVTGNGSGSNCVQAVFLD